MKDLELKQIRVSAPGKTILIGEHSAVYGRPTLLAAIDLRAHVELRTRPNAGNSPAAVTLELPQLDISEEIAWAEILRRTRRCRAAWEEFDADPTPEKFRAVGAEGGAARLSQLALGESALFLGLEEADLPSLHLHVDARLPVGAGFGSSAAVATAIVAATTQLYGRRLDSEQLHALSLDVERRQHGRPSGVDNAAVLHGGLLKISRAPAPSPDGQPTGGELQIDRLQLKNHALLDRVRLYHTGSPAETTGEVVAAARRVIRNRPAEFERVLDGMGEDVETLAEELLRDAPDFARAADAIRRFEGSLEKLGVVPASVCAAIREVERLGGAAKISGAGSLSDPGAGALLVFHEDPSRLDEAASLRVYERLELRLGAPGLRDDPPAGADD